MGFPHTLDYSIKVWNILCTLQPCRDGCFLNTKLLYLYFHCLRCVLLQFFDAPLAQKCSQLYCPRWHCNYRYVDIKISIICTDRSLDFIKSHNMLVRSNLSFVCSLFCLSQKLLSILHRLANFVVVAIYKNVSLSKSILCRYRPSHQMLLFTSWP